MAIRVTLRGDGGHDHDPTHPTPKPAPTPTPHPPPNYNRLGNPSVSELLQFTYGEGLQPSVSPISGPEPIPGKPGEDTLLTLTSDKTYYQWGTPAILSATLLYKSDGAPVVGRPVEFNIQGVTFFGFTNDRGIATVKYTPFGVPDPGQGSVIFTSYAVFLGY